MAETHTEKKKWTLRDFNKKEISFFPVFVVQDMLDGGVQMATNKEVECKQVHIEIKDKNGQTQDYDIGFQELFMFVYYISNEELRRNLQLRQQRQISEIPFEVTFKLDDDEKRAGMAKRLIKLPVDDITMAIARSEVQRLQGKANFVDTVESYFARKTKQRSKLPGIR